jgi:hypothetical protein
MEAPVAIRGVNLRAHPGLLFSPLRQLSGQSEEVHRAIGRTEIGASSPQTKKISGVEQEKCGAPIPVHFFFVFGLSIRAQKSDMAI